MPAPASCRAEGSRPVGASELRPVALPGAGPAAVGPDAVPGAGPRAGGPAGSCVPAADLLRRVRRALDLAERAVRSATDTGEGFALALGLLADKVVAETAMLLLCAARVRDVDEGVAERVDRIARLLVGPARSDSVLAAICLDPGQARDHAFAHTLLSAVGYDDPAVDHLLTESLVSGGNLGPERLPHRRLEQEWLARVWNAGLPRPALDPGLPAVSMLGRPLDALASSREDVYAFTHAVMYLSDLGGRTFDFPRPASAIAADAENGLAYSLERDDFDLTAELLLTWPMLGLPWSPAATLAFSVLTAVEDELGFVPGSAFDRARYDTLPTEERPRYVLTTSYHTGYVMGFLCAAAMQPGCAPPAAVPQGTRGGGPSILGRLERAGPGAGDEPRPRWRRALAALDAAQLDSLAPVLLATGLRQAANACDLLEVRELLHLALAHDLGNEVAPRQAAALLRRAVALSTVTRFTVTRGRDELR